MYPVYELLLSWTSSRPINKVYLLSCLACPQHQTQDCSVPTSLQAGMGARPRTSNRRRENYTGYLTALIIDASKHGRSFPMYSNLYYCDPFHLHVIIHSTREAFFWNKIIIGKGNENIVQTGRRILFAQYVGRQYNALFRCALSCT
jgi:hypothetical protein